VYHCVLGAASFFAFLFQIDVDLAAQAKALGCPDCGGRLDGSNYPRKPRGACCRLGPEYDKRLSFCCAERDCRKRVTPPSVRFLGPKVYLGCAVVLVAAMRHGLSRARLARLRQVLGVAASTVARWRTFWQELFPASRFWQAAKARFAEPVLVEELPASLLERFTGDLATALVALLRFLAPMTTSSAHAHRGGKGGWR